MRKAFSEHERERLLGVKGVGPGVISRLESIGICSLTQLAASDVDTVLDRASLDTGSTCWRNSPLARRAITDAIASARRVDSQER